MRADIEDRIRKLWKTLESHNLQFQALLDRLILAVEQRDLEDIGNVSGVLSTMMVSNCCFATTIQILQNILAVDVQAVAS